MLLEVAPKVGLLTGGEPHPHLGNMSSPHHEDHPLVWMEWAKHITQVLLKGLAPGPDGYPYPQHVRGFRRISPLIREKKKNKNDKSMGNFSIHCSGQYKLIGLLASTGQYHRRLSALALSINTIPSWEPVEFLSQTTEDGRVCLLAMCRVTIDEADNCLHFVFTWLQSAMAIKDDVPRCIFLQGALQATSRLPEVSPWLEDVTHIFNPSHVRWVPIPPPLGMTTVIPACPHPSGTSEGGVLPSLTGPGTTGLPPPTLMGVPQLSTTVADPTETFGSIMGQLPLEGMTLNTNPSDESTARVLHEDITVPAK